MICDVTMLYESGIDPLVAMRIVGHADHQTTANIYTHPHDETLRRAYVNLEQVLSGAQAEKIDSISGRGDEPLPCLCYNGFGTTAI